MKKRYATQLMVLALIVQVSNLNYSWSQESGSADDAQFEDVIMLDENEAANAEKKPEPNQGIGVPDAISEKESDSDIGEPDALDGTRRQNTPSTDEDIRMNLDLDFEEETRPTVEESAPAPTDTDNVEDSAGSENNVVDDTPVSEPVQMRTLRAPTGPNFDKELHFNKIYKDFNEKPHEPEKWSAISQERIGETYTVQEEDTLWDISKTFFGEGSYWPKVWSLNQTITNPHLIEPQQQLIFFPGDMNQEPRLELGDGSQPPEKKEVVKEEPVNPLLPKGVKIPPPQVKRKPFLKIPNSLPLLKTFTFEKQVISAPSIGLTYDRPSNNQLEVTTYATENIGQPLGEIVSVETGGKAAGSMQYVNIKFYSAPPADSMLAIESVDKIPHLEDDEKTLGVIAQIQGSIKLTESVNGAQSIYRCLVTRAFAPVLVGTKIYSGNIQVARLLEKGDGKQIGGQVVGGRFQKRRHVFGTGGIVFFSGGSNVGVSVGDVIGIVANPKVRNPSTQEVENFKSIGKIQAIHVSAGLTTGYVLSASEAIRIGDYSGASLGSAAASGIGEAAGFEDDSSVDSTESDLGSEIDDSFGEDDSSGDFDDFDSDSESGDSDSEFDDF